MPNPGGSGPCQTEVVSGRVVMVPLAVFGGVLWAIGCSSAAEDTSWVVGRQGVVARGGLMETGRPWSLGVEVGEESICLEFSVDGLDDGAVSGGEGCAPIPDGSDPLQAMATGRTMGDPAGDYGCAYGAVSDVVHGVTVVFDDGTSLNAPLEAAPGWPARFFVGCAERAVGVRDVVLSDRSGAPLELTSDGSP